MVLRYIEINNYKLFRDFKLKFANGINLICGQNGSGKSALKDLMFSIVNFLAMPETSDHVSYSVKDSFPYETFCRWLLQKNGSGSIDISFELGEGNEWFRYRLVVGYDLRDGKSRVQEEFLDLISSDSKRNILNCVHGKINMKTDDNKSLSFSCDWNTSALVTGSYNNSNIRRFGSMVAQVFAVQFDPVVIAEDFSVGTQTLGLHGENFSAWHFYKTTTQSEKQEIVKNQCKNFIPGFVSINSPQSGDVFRWKIRTNFLNKDNKPSEIALNELSDGQKKLFALYSLIANVPDGSTIFIDEPENYLAPGELQPWLDAVHDAWEEQNIQFILISHNPKTLNWYHEEALIFKVVGTPPRIEVETNAGNTSSALFDRLSEMGWMDSDTES